MVTVAGLEPATPLPLDVSVANIEVESKVLYPTELHRVLCSNNIICICRYSLV